MAADRYKKIIGAHVAIEEDDGMNITHIQEPFREKCPHRRFGKPTVR